MDMIKKFLVPCMEHLDDARSCAEEFIIRGKLQKGFGTAFMEEAVKKLLVAIEKWIQLMGQGEIGMEVRGIDDFGTAFIYSNFLIDSLTVRAAAVTAGIIVYFHMAAVGTLGDVEAKPAGFTV